MDANSIAWRLSAALMTSLDTDFPFYHEAGGWGLGLVHVVLNSLAAGEFTVVMNDIMNI